MRNFIILFVLLVLCCISTSAHGVLFIPVQGYSSITPLPSWPLSVVASLVSGMLFWRPWKTGKYSFGDNLVILAIVIVLTCLEAIFIGDDFSGTGFAFALPFGMDMFFLAMFVCEILSPKLFQFIVALSIFVPTLSWCFCHWITYGNWQFILYALIAFLVGNGLSAMFSTKNKQCFAL